MLDCDQCDQHFFFDEIFFFCLLTSKIIDTFFLQCDALKFRDLIFLSLALGKNFFNKLTVKAVFNIVMWLFFLSCFTSKLPHPIPALRARTLLSSLKNQMRITVAYSK